MTRGMNTLLKLNVAKRFRAKILSTFPSAFSKKEPSITQPEKFAIKSSLSVLVSTIFLALSMSSFLVKSVFIKRVPSSSLSSFLIFRAKIKNRFFYSSTIVASAKPDMEPPITAYFISFPSLYRKGV